MDEQEEKFLQLLGCGFTALCVPLFVAAHTLLAGYILNQLWGWFLTPVCHVYPPGWAVCAGLDLMVGVVVVHLSNKPTTKSPKLVDVWAGFLGALLGLCLLWGTAYLVHLFV